MATMQTSDDTRNSAASVGMMAPAQAAYPYNPLYAGQLGYGMPAAGYHVYNFPGVRPQNHIDDLSTAFAGLNMPRTSGIPHNYYRLGDGTVLHRQTAPQAYHGGNYMVPQAGSYQHVPTTPGHFAWNGVPQEPADVPGLARRNSSSSNEEVGPQTPFFPGQLAVDHYKRAMGESPQAWSTPSPYSLNYGATHVPQQLMKIDGQYQTVDFEKICSEEPAIPKPVPAIFSSEKSRGTLDKCLKNDTNTTNVYIRGLHPDTKDEHLMAYGGRFGKIDSAKSMLDQSNGACKGFGFIKYYNFDDGENCIRGFFHMGYEAKWARISHNERLKTLGDDNNTNLYISNLPMTYNEQMLMNIFEGYEVMSSKILRDENGISRGVGFARFALPEICAEIIAKFNGAALPEGLNLSIRFADTPDQKKLKNLTAERRQFKTHEYNTAAYGPGSPYASTASPVTAAVPSPIQARIPAGPGFNASQVQSPVYPNYGFPVGGSGAPSARVSGTIETGPADARVKIESPSVAAHAKRSSVSAAKSSDDEDKNALGNITNTARADQNTPAQDKTTGSPNKAGDKITPSKTPRSKRV